MNLKGDTVRISREDLPAATLVRLCGEVDLCNAGAVRDALDTIIDQRRSVILDCSGVSYIDSAGFHVLFRASQDLKRHGCQMLIAAASTPLQHAFRIINMERHIHCVASVAEALSVLQERQ